ncbi:MAG: Uma2 family endonuclease, partial [Verrucomicrobiota bacterium]
SAIKTDLVISLGIQLKGKSCRVYDTDQRVKSSFNGLRTYPDASVFCGDMEYDEEDAQKDTAVNPTALFEVLSQSSESYDRGFKFESFRKVSSLKYYVLIAQDRPHVDVFYRQSDGSWALKDSDSLDGILELPEIGVTLHLADLYQRVKF